MRRKRNGQERAGGFPTVFKAADGGALPYGESVIEKPPTAPPPVEKVLERLARRVPAAEWQRLPRDLTNDLDRHLQRNATR